MLLAQILYVGVIILVFYGLFVYLPKLFLKGKLSEKAVSLAIKRILGADASTANTFNFDQFGFSHLEVVIDTVSSKLYIFSCKVRTEVVQVESIPLCNLVSAEISIKDKGSDLGRRNVKTIHQAQVSIQTNIVSHSLFKVDFINKQTPKQLKNDRYDAAEKLVSMINAIINSDQFKDFSDEGHTKQQISDLFLSTTNEGSGLWQDIKKNKVGVSLASIFFLVVVYFLSSEAPAVHSEKQQNSKFTSEDVCIAAMAALNNHPAYIFKHNGNQGSVINVSYMRPADGKRWAQRCKVREGAVEWAAKDGRWRTHERDEKISYSVEGNYIKIRIKILNEIIEKKFHINDFK